MKALDIALKDVLRALRSVFTLVMIFAAPLLIAGLIALAFGGLAGGDSFTLPPTEVVVANLDHGVPGAGVEAGSMLAEFLYSDELAGVVNVTDAPDEAAARAAVARQEAGVAVIIPADFTQAALGQADRATVTLVPDPALSIGPAIVQELVGQFLDGFAGTQIAVTVAAEQLGAQGIALDEQARGAIAMQYAAWAQEIGIRRGAGAHPALEIRAPAGIVQPESTMAGLLGPIMAGQVIFFAFFTAAQTAESIIREDEEGTLGRLFTTPTTRSTILAGKVISVVLMLVIQLVVVLAIAGLVFGIRWGRPATVALVMLGLIVAAAGFGVMVMSFLRNSRQTGIVMGGVLTFVGMLGGLFTVGVPNMPAAFRTITLLTPHGWALRGMTAALASGGPADVLLPFAVTVGMGVAFFLIGLHFFRRRFA